MLCIRQLSRKPFKTLLGILLVLLATAMLCVSLSQLLSFVWTRNSVESQYATIALPTNKYKITTTEGEDGVLTASYSTVQPPEVNQLLSSLPTQLSEEIEFEEKHTLISAFCDQTNSLNWAEYYKKTAYTDNNDGMSSITVLPYNSAMVVFKANSVSTPYRFDRIQNNSIPNDSGIALDVEGTIEKVYLLHEGFDDPTGYTIRLTVRCEKEDMLSKLDLREGERYLAYGTDYSDLNCMLKQLIGSLSEEAYDCCSWDNIELYSQEEIDSLPLNDPAEMEKNGLTEKVIAHYSDPASGNSLYLTQVELDWKESCSLTVVCSPCLLAGSFGGSVTYYDESTGNLSTVSNEDFDKIHARAGIAHITGSIEDFFEREENEIWREMADVIKINNHAFPVIATDNLMSIAPFGMQEASVSDGRVFSKNEYDSGSAVCMISETLAIHNDLKVGDKIPVRFYEFDYSFMVNLPSLKSANPEAAYFSTYKGFSSDEIEFEIVGLYRQKQEWSDGPYAFTPNTIFVPKASVVGQTTTNDSGIFYSLLLKNGAQEKVEAYLAENGYEGLLAYYDQGYSDISDNLTKFFSTSVKILLVGIVGWIVFLIVFLFMFPAQQKTEAERMWTLGAPRSLVIRNYIANGIGVALPGIVLGGALSFVLVQIVLQKLSEQAGFTLNAAQAPLLIAGLLVIQFAVITGLVFLIARAAARRLYK